MPAIANLFSALVPQMSSLAGVVFSVVLAWQIYTVIYNIFFHPLRDFPGPLYQRASALPWAWQSVRGIQAFHTQKLHDKYGPVVRVTPKHLSFTDAAAWRDIYGHLIGHKSGLPEMGKTREFVKTIDDIPTSILNSDREEHGRVRRALAHGFSDASMRQQEGVVVKYIDLLLRCIHEEADSGSEYHPWIKFIFGTVKWDMNISALSYLGFHWLVQLMFRAAGGSNDLKQVRGYTHAILEKRLAMPEGREDLFKGLVSKREEWNLSFEKLAANVFILIFAGSETTATTLAGATYFLLTHPEVLAKLQHEVRLAFTSAVEINISSVNKLSYILAVLNEALRMYLPVTSNLVRVVPSGGAQIAGHFVPEGTYVEVQYWSINHSRDNFANPWDFKPERFLDPKKTDVLDALQAFSNGPRNCIGRNLAYAEMRIILARLVFDFDMRLADDSKNWLARQKTYTLWDRLPLNVYFTPVEGR